jgi:hypothetical protein
LVAVFKVVVVVVVIMVVVVMVEVFMLVGVVVLLRVTRKNKFQQGYTLGCDCDGCDAAARG